MAGYIFGGNTPWTYDELQRKRAVAESLLAGAGEAPRNVGEGLNAIGKALAYRGLEKRASKEEARLRGEFDTKWGAAFGGMPGMGGAAGGAGGGGYAPGALWTPTEKNPLPKADPGIIGGGQGGLGFSGAAPADPGMIGATGGMTLPPQGGGTAEEIFQSELMAGGLPEHVVHGIMMNAMDESGFDPNAIGDNGAALGILQWNGPRKKALEQFAASVGGSPTDPKVQAQFTLYELQGPEKAAFDALMSTKSAGEAGAAFVNQFERPAEEHRARREAAYLGGAATSDGAAPADGGMPQMDMASLAALAGDPMASPQQKAIVEALIAQQLQGMDPLRQLEMEKAQLELAQMKDPGQAQPEELTDRMALLTAAGVDPASPEGKNYLLTGELPEAAAAQPAPMTADERAKWGIPASDTAPYVLVDGVPKAISGGGQTINVGGGESEFDKTIAKADATAFGDFQKAGVDANTGISTLSAMEAAMADPNFYSGTMQGSVEAMKRAAVSLGIADPSSITSMESFGALAKGAALSAMGGSLGAGFSNADRDFVEKQVPTLGNTPEGNMEIIRIQKALLTRKQEMAALAAQYAAEREAQGKRFDQAGFEAKAREFAEANPLFGAKPPAAGGAPGGSGGVMTFDADGNLIQ